MATIAVSDEAGVVDAVRAARARKSTLEIVGAGTKRGFGRPVEVDDVLDVSALAGIVKYEPEELVTTVRAATRIAEIEDALAACGQRLGFDPADWGPLFGAPSGAATIGGVLSADACGPARLRYGAARDHLLGFHAVNGLGESYKAGGRVVKNVTGFDLPKLMCGAMGTLGVLTEVTLRVVPRATSCVTMIVRDVAPEDGLALLRRVWSSPLEAAGLAYIPSCAAAAFGLSDVGAGSAIVCVDGAIEPLREKLGALRSLLDGRAAEEIDDPAVFGKIGSGGAFIGAPFDVWRVSVPPSQAAEVAQSIGSPLWYADWAGGLLWIATLPDDDESGERLRDAAAAAGGHAVLMRASSRTRSRVAVFPPEAGPRAALTAAVKAAFDPLHIFNPGRMYEGI
jgi:glycolate oxidase FAD binding subunit